MTIPAVSTTNSGNVEDPLLTVRQAQSVLPYSTAWYANHRWRGTGPPFVKIGNGRVLYRRSALLAWIEQQSQKRTA